MFSFNEVVSPFYKAMKVLEISIKITRVLFYLFIFLIFEAQMTDMVRNIMPILSDVFLRVK